MCLSLTCPQNVKNQNPKHLFFSLVLFCYFSGFFNTFSICTKYRTRLRCNNRVSQVVLVVKNPLAKAGDIRDVGSISGPLKEGMATHSNVLTWRILWAEEPDRLQSMELAKSWTWLKWLSLHTSTRCNNTQPLHFSGLPHASTSVRMSLHCCRLLPWCAVTGPLTRIF